MKSINIKTIDKFKDNLISLRFASNDLEDISARSLLAMMLVDTCQKYDNKVKMNEILDHMYGAILNARVINYGKAHVIEIMLSVLNNDFVNEDLLTQQIDLLKEIIYFPNFNEKSFVEAQDNLLDLIKRNDEDPSRLVIKKALQLTGSDYPLSYSRLGDYEKVRNLSLNDVKVVYEKMLAKDKLIINVIGDVDKTSVEKKLSKIFSQQMNQEEFAHAYMINSLDYQEKTSHLAVDQDYFALVYTTNTSIEGKEYWASQLATMMLGQLPSSFLFQEIREKRSLSYNTFATQLSYDSIMLISGGIRQGHVEEAAELSQEQVSRLGAGDFDESLLTEAKVMLINQLISSQDDNQRMLNSEYRQVILDDNVHLENVIEDIESIDQLDIKNFATKLRLKGRYIIKGENDEKIL